MRTIKAFGYLVTGDDDIITEIEELAKVKQWEENYISINWKNFKENDIYYENDVPYKISINHKDKTVILIKYRCY